MAIISSEMKQRIPGWGADLDPKNRPGVPRERKPPQGTGAHWEEPERQVPHVRILVSTEHQGLTATFGSACPPRGLSGKIREYAYRLSEGKKAHWILLLLADRIDEVEGVLESLVRGRPHNPISEMGLKSEFRHQAYRTRFGQNRADVRRQKREALILLGLSTGAILTRRFLGRKAS